MIFNFDEIEYIDIEFLDLNNSKIIEDKVCIGNMKQFKKLVNTVFKNICDLYDDNYSYKNKPSVQTILEKTNNEINYDIYMKIKRHLEYINIILYKRGITKKFIDYIICSDLFRNVEHQTSKIQFMRIHSLLNCLERRQFDNNLCYI